jgi:hypothetical protein
MIRGALLLFSVALAILAVAFVFRTSQQVTDTQRDLSRLYDDISREEDRIHVLNAEWSYLNRPDRLERLALQYTDLRPAIDPKSKSLPLRLIVPADLPASESALLMTPYEQPMLTEEERDAMPPPLPPRRPVARAAGAPTGQVAARVTSISAEADPIASIITGLGQEAR